LKQNQVGLIYGETRGNADYFISNGHSFHLQSSS